MTNQKPSEMLRKMNIADEFNEKMIAEISPNEVLEVIQMLRAISVVLGV